jgi:hypothetical protein
MRNRTLHDQSHPTVITIDKGQVQTKETITSKYGVPSATRTGMVPAVTTALL